MFTKKRNRNKTMLVILPIILIIAAFVGWISANARYARSNIESYESEQIQKLQELLNNTTDPEMRRSLEVKISILQNEATERAVALLTPMTKPDDPCALRPTLSDNPDSERRLGIFEGPIPFRSTDLTITNQWQAQVNGFWTHLYAGSLFNDGSQGVIVVSTEGMSLGGRYLTPIKVGAIRITSADEFRLTLVAEDGSVFYFDVPGQSFVSSPTEVVPTLTPAPTYMPTISPCQEIPPVYRPSTSYP